MTDKKHLAKSTTIVGSGIMLSRILGFIRDILIANFFGIGISVQAFVMAFTLPNSLRHLAAEGAVNAALVPVLTEYQTKRSKAEFWRFANTLFNISLAVLLLITIAGILAAPLLVKMIAPGFTEDPEKLALTISLLRVVFPYILLTGLAAFCVGVLHTFKHFIAPAVSSALFNIALIGGMLIFYPSVNIAYLGCAVLVGGLLQLAIQLPSLIKEGQFFSFKAGFINEGVKKVGRLLVPRMVGAGIYQINIIVDRILASLPLAGEGAVAALYYGNRLFQLPLALFGISIAIAALPTMSSQAMENNIDKLKETTSFSIRNMLFFSVPASVGLMVLSRPIIKVLFERNEFTAYATGITSAVLFFYAIGLIAYGGVKILVAAFHSMQDTVTPVRVASFALLSNIVLNIIFMIPLKAGGLALATSLAGFINVSALFIALRKRIGWFEEKEIFKSLVKSLSASVIMGIVAYALMTSWKWGGGLKDTVNLVLIICVSMAVYLVTAKIFKMREIEALLAWIKKN